MKDSPALPLIQTLSIAAESGFGLVELRNSSPLILQLLPTGVPFAWRHGTTLINQLLPGPADHGLFRLLLRWHDATGQISGWKSLVAAGETFARTADSSAAWTCTAKSGVHCETHLELHPHLAAWTWRVQLRNHSSDPLRFDVLHAQDLGLADEGAVRNNEAYTSQYIDLKPHPDDELGWTILARQNQTQAQGRRPWLAVACTNGATAFCTDGWQFFGVDHRLTNEPAAARSPSLPTKRLQYECALAGLQSRAIDLAPGATTEITFVVRFVEDHPAASSAADVAFLREAMNAPFPARRTPQSRLGENPPATAPSLFQSAPWLHGESPAAADWEAWFPGRRRHEERGADAQLLSFFHGAATHVVSLTKEAAIPRPHGHILRSGDAQWFDAGHFGLTCYAAGIFCAQAYLGHPSFARLLSVVRNALNVPRASGQRVFVRRGQEWRQLGIPSAFAMTPGDARWLYRFGEDVIEARVSCPTGLAAAVLELHVLSGAPTSFLISHELVLGAVEFEHPITVEAHPEEGFVQCRPATESLVGRHQPGLCFAIAAADASQVDALGGDRLLYEDGVNRSGPYVVIRTATVVRTGIILVGTLDGPGTLPATLAAARAAFSSTAAPSTPPASPVRLAHNGNPAVSRIDDILPWFTHNAAIHFSAPHGLEQYGGAAWGVRDVCQGSVEWLLAAGEFAVVRRILEVVFAQQYPNDGGWPQWFMFPPYQFIQQAHSHGDVCFWPVKALCDYIEASNDTAFLHTRVGYTDPQQFEPCGPQDTLITHCDRVVDQCEARFVAGTALVNYGDGDWDDTLQPADPAMRTRMASAWTVGLAFHTFRQLARLYRRIDESARSIRLDQMIGRMRQDFVTHLMPDGIVTGFLITEDDGRRRPLLHPSDTVTRIRYRLLPMTRSILAELFTLEEAQRHLRIIEQELRDPDGVRLMSEPSTYAGGIERLFKRAETAANVGREIGLMYVHAHLRYAEALAKVGDAERLFHAMQVVNPIALAVVVPNAAPRQSNVYFSSSDADFADRFEAGEQWSKVHTGEVAVRGGWRLYSSGPGLFLHTLRSSVLGFRELFEDIVFDPVLPTSLDGLVAQTSLLGRSVEIRYTVRHGNFCPRAVIVNGTACAADRREPNPYRPGGVLVARTQLATLLRESGNRIEIEL